MQSLLCKKDSKSTLSYKVLLLRYKNARNNRVKRFSISDIRKTKDVKHWLNDKVKRNWLRVYGDSVILM